MQLIPDVRYFPPPSLFPPQVCGFYPNTCYFKSQDSISTTSLTPALWKLRKKKKGTRCGGGGAITNSQHTLRASHWPELHYITTLAAREAWKSLLKYNQYFNKESKRNISWAANSVCHTRCISLSELFNLPWHL